MPETENIAKGEKHGMRKLFAGALAAFMLIILTACAETASSYNRGHYTDTGYESEWLGLRFTVPEGMVMYADNEIQQMMGVSASLLAEDKETGEMVLNMEGEQLTYEMIVGSETQGSVVLMTEKTNETDAEAYVKASIEASRQITSGEITLGEMGRCEIGGQEFVYQPYTITAEADGQSRQMMQSFCARYQEDRMVAITLTYGSQEQKERLIAAFSPWT